MRKTLVLDKVTWVTQPEVTHVALQDVWKRVSDLTGYYPNFQMWFCRKVIPGIMTGERILILEYREGRIAGLSIVKDDGVEQKLSCLRVMDGYISTGLGVRLFEKSFEVLNNQKPLLSIAEEQKPSFSRLFDYFGFQLDQTLDGFYRPNRVEYVFNGMLIPGDIDDYSDRIDMSEYEKKLDICPPSRYMTL